MIPFSVSDILKILDDIPIWKAVSKLPARVAELERKVQALEEALASSASKGARHAGRECPICDATMKVKAEHAHPEFAFAGVKVHEMECPECGNKTTRDFTPGKGYA